MSPGGQLVQQPVPSIIGLVPAPIEPTNNITITEDTQTNSMVS